MLVIFAAALLLRMLRPDRVVVLVSCWFVLGLLQFSTVASLRIGFASHRKTNGHPQTIARKTRKLRISQGTKASFPTLSG